MKFDVTTVQEETSEDDLLQLIPERGMNVWTKFSATVQ